MPQALHDYNAMPFGAHKGRKMKDIPDGYLVWLYSQDWLKGRFPAVYDYIVRNANTLPDLILRAADRAGTGRHRPAPAGAGCQLELTETKG